MAGPALRKVDSHTAIHEAALQEARELTNVTENFWKQGDKERALHTAYILIEHWQTRTLAHADAEEDGLYQEIAAESEEKKEQIIELTRDHDLMRKIVSNLKEELIENGITNRILSQLHALIIVDELHNEDEMDVLPDHEH